MTGGGRTTDEKTAAVLKTEMKKKTKKDNGVRRNTRRNRKRRGKYKVEFESTDIAKQKQTNSQLEQMIAMQKKGVEELKLANIGLQGYGTGSSMEVEALAVIEKLVKQIEMQGEHLEAVTEVQKNRQEIITQGSQV